MGKILTLADVDKDVWQHPISEFCVFQGCVMIKDLMLPGLVSEKQGELKFLFSPANAKS